jgi:hypothetical protein
MRTPQLLIAAATLSACGSFENPEVVLDFRVLAMSATLPEQVIDIDIENPQMPAELLEQMEPADVCVLVVDPLFERRLTWQMSVCVLDNDERCTGQTQYSIGSGVWDDPDLTAAPPSMCARVEPDGNLLAVALAYFNEDQFRGIGGIYYGVSLRVGGEGEDPADDLYAAKNLRLMPRIPADVQANHNPYFDHLDATLPDAEPIVLPFGRCVDQAAPVEVAPDTRVRLTPVEPDGVREVYVVPTTDGTSRTFTESLTYQWLATAGNFTAGRTGGPRDAFGNPAPLFTDWVAPDAEDLEGTTDVDLWIIQRDERLGLRWYQSCVRVVVP